MSIIVNGVTIPTSDNYIKVGNTNVEKVVVVKGGVSTVVWQKESYRKIYTYTFPSTNKAYVSKSQVIAQIGSGTIGGTIKFRIVKANNNCFCGLNNATLIVSGVEILSFHYPSHVETGMDTTKSYTITPRVISGGDLKLNFTDDSNNGWTLYVDTTEVTLT